MKKNILLLSLILTLGILILSASVSMLMARESDSTSKVTQSTSSIPQTPVSQSTTGVTTTTPAIDNVTTAPTTDEVTPPSTEEVTPPSTEEVTPPSTEEITPPHTEEVTPPPTEEVTPPHTEEVTPPPTEEVTPPSTEEVTPPHTEEITPPHTDEVTPPPTEEVTPPPTEEITPPPTEEVTPPPTEEVTPPPTDEVTPPTEEITPPPTEEVTPPPTEEVTPPPTEEVTPPPTEEVTPPPTEEVTPPTPTPTPTPPAPPTEDVPPPSTEESVKQEGDALEDILKPSQITLLRPVASGTLVKSNTSAIIDYSHTDDGYIMVKFTASTTVRLKVQVTGPTTTYTYNIKPQEWNVFPLSDGNGEYRLKVLKNVVDNRYSTVLSLNYTVKLKDEFAPFLRPNQYVNYENATATMNKAAELVQGKKTLLKKVEAIYSYVINNISYDYEEAATVANDYLPVLDEVLATKKGICFDYAALMTGMLRSQNIACQLVVGYADGAYHAWINVWSPDQGWINGSIFFDGVEWKLMDPTYAAGGSSPTGIQYTSKYIY